MRMEYVGVVHRQGRLSLSPSAKTLIFRFANNALHLLTTPYSPGGGTTGHRVLTPHSTLRSSQVLTWLVFLFSTFSLSTLLDAYFAPYLIFSAWLSLVTFLQHSDPQAVYYRDGEWTYLKVRSLPRRAVSVSVGYQKGRA
jgi:fatty acid desaturase